MIYTSACVVALTKPRKGFQGVLYFYDAEGKRRRKTKKLKAATKTEAKRELAAWRAEMEAEAETGNATGLSPTAAVPDYVADMVDRLEASGAIEPSTVAGYRSTVKHIAAGFPGVAVAELTPAKAQAWEAGMLAEGLSSSTVGKAHRLLKQAMKEAVHLGLLQWNPMEAVRPPKRNPKKPGINALDLDGRTRMLAALEAMERTPWTMAAIIALYTGLREAEICALRWSDLDEAAGVLWVRRSIGNGKGGTYLKEPKTDRARDVAVPPTLAAEMGRWKEARRALYAEAGAVMPANSYVLGFGDRYLNPTALGRQWSTMARALGIKGTEGRIPTFHDLRHTWATMYLTAGGDVKTAASNLGHADASMTLNVYASADPAAKRRAAELTEAAIRAPEGATLKFPAEGAGA